MEGSLWSSTLWADPSCSIEVTRSFIGEGAGVAAIWTMSPASIRVSECNISVGSGYAIWYEPGAEQSSTIDMRNNYWGTTDEAEIQRQIWDIHDDPTTLATVLYLPFAESSVSGRRESMGGLKGQFREQE